MNVEDLSTVCCDSCRMYDASLRCSSHPKVVSVLVSAKQSARVGIFCARCRAIEAAKATAVSLLAGWWSPRGPMLTIAAISANAKGGEQNPTTNAQLLRGLARLEVENRNLELASMFARAAHSVQPQRENSRLIDELDRKGQRATAGASMWHLLPYAPIIAFVLAVGFIGLRIANIRANAAATDATEQRASVVPIRAAAPAPTAVENLTGTADDLEKRLTPDSSRRLAAAYVRARLNEIRRDIGERVRKGDDLMAIDASIKGFAQQPAVASLLSRDPLRSAYDRLSSAMNDSTRYYHGGAPAETIERTLGESLDTTAIIEFVAIENQLQGHTERANALGSAVDRRLDSVDDMKLELLIRRAVIQTTTRAIDDCLNSLRD